MVGLMYHQIGRNKNECPLGIEDSLEDGETLGESKTLIDITKTLDIKTTKGEAFKRYSSMLKRLSAFGFPLVDLPQTLIKDTNFNLRVETQDSNAIVTAYKTDELERSVDPSNKNVRRYSKHTFTQQPRMVCSCKLNDAFRDDSTYEAPKCYAILESNTNPHRKQHIGIGSKCGQYIHSMFEFNQLKTYHTSAILKHYFKSINIPTLDIDKRNNFVIKRASKLNLRINQNGDSWVDDFYSNNKDFRHLPHPESEREKGICQDCNSQGFQCVTKQKKGQDKIILGEMQVNVLEYAGWNSEYYDMVGLEQSWNQPKYLMNLETKEIKSVQEWGLFGFRCRPTWRYTLVKAICANEAGKTEQETTTYGWVKYLPTLRLQNALDEINNVSTENLLFEDVEGDYY